MNNEHHKTKYHKIKIYIKNIILIKASEKMLPDCLRDIT